VRKFLDRSSAIDLSFVLSLEWREVNLGASYPSVHWKTSSDVDRMSKIRKEINLAGRLKLIYKPVGMKRVVIMTSFIRLFALSLLITLKHSTVTTEDYFDPHANLYRMGNQKRYLRMRHILACRNIMKLYFRDYIAEIPHNQKY